MTFVFHDGTIRTVPQGGKSGNKQQEIGWLSAALSPCAYEAQWRIPSFVGWSEARDPALSDENRLRGKIVISEGFAFPRWLGGPVRYAAAQSDEWLREGLQRVWESDPIGFAPAAGSGAEIPQSIRRALDEVGG